MGTRRVLGKLKLSADLLRMRSVRINKAYAEQIKPLLLGGYFPAITLLITL
jgi:hypothetical protein